MRYLSTDYQHNEEEMFLSILDNASWVHYSKDKEMFLNVTSDKQHLKRI